MKRKKNKKRSKTKRNKRDSSSEGSDEEEKLKSLKKKRRRHSSTDSDSSSSTSAVSSEDEKRKRKHKRKRKRSKDVKDKSAKKRLENDDECFDVPLSLMNPSSSMVPMTKEEWEKKQNVTKRIFDETTGRYRLVKGDGEIIEEIVSKDRHKEINKQATKGDGSYFQSQLLNNGR